MNKKCSKRQKINMKHDKEPIQENEQIPSGSRCDHLSNPHHLTSCTTDHIECNKTLFVHNVPDMTHDFQQQSKIYKSRSQSNSGSSTQCFKHFIPSLNVSKVKREKVDKSKSDKSGENPVSWKRRFHLLNEDDKRSLRVQLSIWFPCLFPRPTFKVLKKALVRMTTRVYRNLWTFEITGMNQQISKDKGQRTLFRNERKQETFSKTEPTYFVSSVVPECQKRVNSKSCSNTFAEDDNNIMKRHSKIGDCNEFHLIVDNVKHERRSLIRYNSGEHKYESKTQEKYLPRDAENYESQQMLKEAEILHHQLPEWFKSIIKNEIAIDIVPMNSRNENGMSTEAEQMSTEAEQLSTEAEQLKSFQRRLLLSRVYHSKEIPSINGHLFMSVLEQETQGESIFMCCNFAGSASQTGQPTGVHISSSQLDRSGENKLVSTQNKDFTRYSEAYTGDYSPQATYFVPFSHTDKDSHSSPGRWNNIPNYDRGDSWLEKRNKQIRKHIRSRLEAHQTPESSSDISHEPNLRKKTLPNHNHSRLSSTGRRVPCFTVNKYKSKNSKQKSIGDRNLLPSVKIKSKGKTTEGNNQLKSVRLQTAHLKKNENVNIKQLFNSSLLELPRSNIDRDLNQNLDLQREELQRGTKQTMIENPCFTELPERLEPDVQHTRHEKMTKQRQVTISTSDLDQRVETSSTAKTIDYGITTASNENKFCTKIQDIAESNDTHSEKYNEKRGKKVRFDKLNGPDKVAIVIMNKSNSSLHGVKEVFEKCSEIVVDDVSESNEFSTATITAHANNQPISAKQAENVASYVASSVRKDKSASKELVSKSELNFKCLCDSTNTLYADRVCLSDKSKVFLENNEVHLGNKAKCFESVSQCMVHNYDLKKYTNSFRDEECTSLYGCHGSKTNTCSAKLTISSNMNELSKQKSQNMAASRKRTPGLSSRESLISFVKEQWRSHCLTSPVEKPKSGADNSQDKECIWEQNTASGDSYHLSCELSRKEYSRSNSKMQSLIGLQVVECGDCIKSYSLKQEPSYEIMCEERRENYRKLCRTLSEYYQSISPEELHDVHSNVSFPVTLQSDVAKARNTHIETKSLEKSSSESKYGTPRNSPASTFSAEQMVPTDYEYLQANLKKKWERVLGKSTMRSLAQSITPKSCNSHDKAKSNIGQTLGASFFDKENPIISLDKQTQTSPIDVFTTRPKVIHDSIASMLELSLSDAEWLKNEVNSWATINPQKPSEFYFILFAMDKLLTLYYRSIRAEIYRHRKLRDNSKHKRNDRSKTHSSPQSYSLKREHIQSQSPGKWLRSYGRECVRPQTASHEKHCIQNVCNEQTLGLAQNCSVNNGRDSPPSTSAQGRDSPPSTSAQGQVSPSSTSVQGQVSPPNTSDQKSAEARVDPPRKKQKYKSKLKDHGLIQVGENTYKFATAFDSQSASVNISESPPENISQSPPENILKPPPVNILKPPRQKMSKSSPKNISQSSHGKTPKLLPGNNFRLPNRKMTLSPIRNISPLPAGTNTQSPIINISQSPTTLINKFPSWDVVNSTVTSIDDKLSPDMDDKLSPEMANYFEDKRPESNLVKEFTDKNPILPSRLSLMSQYSKKRLLPKDTTTYGYVKAHAPGQQLKETLFMSSFTGKLQECPTYESNKKTQDQPTLINDDSKTSMRKYLIDAPFPHKPQIIKENCYMKLANHYIPKSPENFHSPENIPSTYTELPKSWKSILKSPLQFMGQGYTPPNSHQHVQTVEHVNNSKCLSNFETVKAINAAMQTTNKSVIVPKQNNETTVCHEYNQGNTRQTQNADQMSGAQMLFRSICDSLDKSSKLTNSMSRQLRNRQAGSKFDEELRFGADGNRYGTTLSIDTHNTYNTGFCIDDPVSAVKTRIPLTQDNVNCRSRFGSRNIGLSASPDEPNVIDSRSKEIDNRLLDPSKCYNDVSLLLDLYKQNQRTQNRSIAIQVNISSKPPGQLEAYIEEKSAPCSVDVVNSSQARHCTQICRPVQSVVNSNTEVCCEKPGKSTLPSNPKSTNIGINVCVQTCACISKDNGSCQCGYYSIHDKSRPKETTHILPSNNTINRSQGIKCESVCILTPNGKKREKLTNVCAHESEDCDLGLQYPAQPCGRKCPSETKHRNKKCQTGHHNVGKSDPALLYPCQQLKSKTIKPITPVNIECTRTCFSSHKIDNHEHLKKETAKCCNQKQFGIFTKHSKTRNLSSEESTNSTDEYQHKICQGDDLFQNYEINMSDSFAKLGGVPVCSGCTKKQQYDRAQRAVCGCTRDQESSVIVAQVDQKTSINECCQEEGKQPIIHIQYRSRHGKNSPQYMMCGNKARILGQQMKDQISGIIKSSKQLQQQAAQLTKKCKRLDKQKWPPINWNGLDSACKCNNKVNLLSNCENNNKNTQQFSDKNSNANPSCGHLLQGEGNLNILKTTSKSVSLTSIRDSQHVNEMVAEAKKQKYTATTLTETCREIHEKNTHFINTHFYGGSSRKKWIIPSRNDNKRNQQPSHCECFQQSKDHKRRLFSQECRPWIENKNQSWNARPVTLQEDRDEKKNTRLRKDSIIYKRQYFFYDPSEEAYQYVRSHFPAINMCPLHKVGNNVTFDFRKGDASCSQIVLEEDKQYMETQSGAESSLSGRIIGDANLHAKQYLNPHDLEIAKLIKDWHLSGRRSVKNSSMPGLHDSRNKHEFVTLCKHNENIHSGRRSKYTKWNMYNAGRHVESKIRNESTAAIPGDAGSVLLISAYKDGETPPASKSYWQWAYTIGSLTQSTLPVRPNMDRTNDVNRCYKTSVTSHNDMHRLRGPSALIGTNSNTTAFRDLPKVTHLVNTCTDEQKHHQPSVTARADTSFISSPLTEDSRQSCFNCRSSAASSLSKTRYRPETNISECAICSHVSGNRELTPAVCVKNKRINNNLHQNQNSFSTFNIHEQKADYNYLKYDTPWQPTELSLDQSSSGSSLISIEIKIDPANIVDLSKCKSLTATSADCTDSQELHNEVSACCQEEERIFCHNYKSAEVEQQNGNKLQQRNRGQREDIAADSAICRPVHESSTTKTSEYTDRNKRRTLPQIKHRNRQTHTSTVVDSQDSSHGIEDLPLDSVSTKVERLESNYIRIKCSKNYNMTSNEDQIIDCKNITPLHKRAVLTRPLAIPKYERNTHFEDSHFKPTSKDSKEHSVSNMRSCVVSVEAAGTAALHPPACSVSSDELNQTPHKGEFMQFEVSMDCGDGTLVNTNENPGNKLNVQKGTKKRNNLNYSTKLCTSIPSSRSRKPDESENVISSASLGFHGIKENPTRESCNTDALASSSVTATSSSQIGNRLSCSTDRNEEDYGQDHASEGVISPVNETKANTSSRWHPCLFGSAEVIAANEETVVIEGAYIRRFSSEGKLDAMVTPKNNNREVEDERLGCQQTQVIPFRLKLFRDATQGNTNHVSGTYSRQLLTSNSFFHWNFIIDLF